MARAPLGTTTRRSGDQPLREARRARWIGPGLDALNVVEWARYASDVLVLMPAAALLPLRWGLALAHALGVVEALSPLRAARSTRAEVAALGVRGRWRQFQATAARLAFPRKDFFYLARFARGRDELADWRIEEVGGESLHRMLAEGRSVVLATGHFSLAGSTLRRVVLPRRSMSLVGEPVPWQLSPFRLRLRLATGVRVRARARALRTLPPAVGASPRQYVPDMWTRGRDPDAQPARSPHIQETMLAHLAEPGALLVVAVDAVWPKPGALRHPFAGRAEQQFAVGGARVARLAQCPVVPYVITLGGAPRTVRVEFGPAIEPALPDDEAADARLTRQLLEWIEVQVGRYPEQYLALIGVERRWDAAAERWVGASSETQAAAVISADAAS